MASHQRRESATRQADKNESDSSSDEEENSQSPKATAAPKAAGKGVVHLKNRIAITLTDNDIMQALLEALSIESLNWEHRSLTGSVDFDAVSSEQHSPRAAVEGRCVERERSDQYVPASARVRTYEFLPSTYDEHIANPDTFPLNVLSSGALPSTQYRAFSPLVPLKVMSAGREAAFSMVVESLRPVWTCIFAHAATWPRVRHLRVLGASVKVDVESTPAALVAQSIYYTQLEITLAAETVEPAKQQRRAMAPRPKLNGHTSAS